MNILVVDDDPTSRLILEATLKKAGHQVVAAKNGAEALVALEKAEFPVVISDMVMPGMDGLELCRRIRALNRRHYTYIILLTTVSGKYGCLVGMKAGADDFVAKPFDEELLAARLVVAERVFNAQSQVKRFDATLCMCSLCKRVRDEENAWHQIESYVAEHTDTKVTKGYCPECVLRMSGEKKNVAACA